MMRRFIALSVVMTLCAFTVHAQDAKIKTEKNIIYGTGDDANLELDLAMPADVKGPLPAVVCVHGGGWRGGNRQSLQALTEVLAKHNFVAVTVTYRLTDKAKFPAQIEDCKASVRWLRANAEKYSVNPDKIGAVGFSAGGHLVCLMGAADEKAGLEGKGGNPKQSSKVQAVVSFFGPTDFVEKTWANDVENVFLIPFIGGKYEDKKAEYRKASPIVYCTKECPPFLFFHGTKDVLVGIEHSQKMEKELKRLGVFAELVTMEGEAHGWGGEKLTKTLNQTVKFFEEKLRK